MGAIWEVGVDPVGGETTAPVASSSQLLFPQPPPSSHHPPSSAATVGAPLEGPSSVPPPETDVFSPLGLSPPAHRPSSASNGPSKPPFVEELFPTAAEVDAQAQLDAAFRSSRRRYLAWLADSPSPMPPWRPGRAVPIVCGGKEYYPGYFSIPKENIVDHVPAKTQDWATVIPGRRETYVFKEEAAYRKDLERSRFGLTRRRYGFATNRNLELLAAGTMPYFCGIDLVPRVGTLSSHPKQLFSAVMHFPGVHAKCFPHKRAVGLPLMHRAGSSEAEAAAKMARQSEGMLVMHAQRTSRSSNLSSSSIISQKDGEGGRQPPPKEEPDEVVAVSSGADPVASTVNPGAMAGGDHAVGAPSSSSPFNRTLYDAISAKLLVSIRTSMTTEFMARYFLSATSLAALPRSVLVLWASHYTIMLTGFIHGLTSLGVRVEDVPRRPEIYQHPMCDAARKKTYAKGWFFFCRARESANLTRSNIAARIRQREFDLIVISITDTLTYHMKNVSVDVPHWDDIVQSYPKKLILTMNDADLIKPMQADVAHKQMWEKSLYFKRETHGCREKIW